MAQRQYGYEMEDRGQRNKGYSGGYGDYDDRGSRGDEYGRHPRGDEYGRNPRGDEYGRHPKENQFERSPRDQYGMDSRGDKRSDKYGMDPRRDQYPNGAREQHYDMGDGHGVVSRQPGKMGRSRGPGFGGIPPGLEYLAQLDQLLVHQQVELCEILTGCETQNTYEVKNSMGQQMFVSKEDTNWCTRQCCGPIRPFDMQVFDNQEREVLQLSRPLRCQGCCYPCCLQEMDVRDAGGQVLGTIRQRWSVLKPKVTVHGPDGEHIFTIRGPICKFSCCGRDVKFRVLTATDEQEIGNISKQWSGLARELCTDSDSFSITFPIDLDVSMKATLFGALFLIDFMYFERSN